MKFKMWKYSFFVIYLTSILTFFLLWLNYSYKVNDFYVKNILEREENKTFNLKDDIIDKYVTNSKDLDLEKFWQVYSYIKKDFYWSGVINKSDLVDWAISWMVDSLWDKHSEYMTLETTKKFDEALTWDFEWIWAVVETNPVWVIIDRVLKWSPASKFWLLSWDILIKADWEDLKDLDLYDAVWKIKWPAGTKVLLTVLREWEEDFLEIEVIRNRIKIPSVESETFENNLWYISINIFWTDTSSEFKKVLDELKDTDWLIIDLRDNWWWYLLSAVEILSNFIKNWEIIVTTKYKGFLNKDEFYKSQNVWEVFDKKVVVLINENSASASEITAWALKDYEKAILVWKKSYWKWSVQEPFKMADWSMLKLTIAKWNTPKGEYIDWKWITPDIEVDFEKQDYNVQACLDSWKCSTKEDFKFYDRQLERAKEILNDFIKTWSIWLTIDKYNKEDENEEEEK